MKVAFLDFDGVLNSERFLQTLEAKHKRLGHLEPSSPKSLTTCTCFRIDQQIDRDAVACLNRLITATGAVVVVSSSWRVLYDLPTLQKILDSHGFAHRLYDATPDGERDPRVHNNAPPEADRLPRGLEIDVWLRDHPEVTSYVILDDSGGMLMHTHRLMKTDSDEGLLDAHVDAAILMLTTDIDASEALHAVLRETP